MFLQQLINGVTIGSMYALVAIGYSMIFSVLQLINFPTAPCICWAPMWR